MEIKTAVRSDARILSGIIRDANIPVAKMLGLGPDNAPAHPSLCTEDWVLEGMDRGETYYLVQCDGVPCGCVAYEDPEPGVAYLNRLAVLPRFQNQGLGRGLVDHVAMRARIENKTKVSIGIIKSHDPLRQWYERLGFRAAGTRQFGHLPFEVMFMHLTLTREE